MIYDCVFNCGNGINQLNKVHIQTLTESVSNLNYNHKIERLQFDFYDLSIIDDQHCNSLLNICKPESVSNNLK